MRVLLVEDDPILGDGLVTAMRSAGYTVDWLKDGKQALQALQTENLDLVVLDLGLPGLDGLDVIKHSRKQDVGTPILILTARDTIDDRITGLDLGADDYLTKPFGVGELLARVKAVLRRSRWSETTVRPGKLQQGDISVDLERHEVIIAKHNIELTPTEFNLLVYLMENSGKVLSHRMILQNVWGPEYGEEHEYLRVYIGHLRQKIEADPGKPEYIITKRGIGYCFESP